MPEEPAVTYPAFLPTYDRCYVCGQNHPRGLRIRFSAEASGHVHADFRPDHTQTGYEDVVHGGVVSALMDELLGWPIVLQTGRMCYTGELTVRYLRPVHASRVYRATASPGIRRGRCWEGTGNLSDELGKIHAQARGKYFLLSEAETAAVVERLTYQAGDLPVLQEMRRRAREASPGSGDATA